MADKMKKWKLGEGNRIFQEQWTEQWCFVWHKRNVRDV